MSNPMNTTTHLSGNVTSLERARPFYCEEHKKFACPYCGKCDDKMNHEPQLRDELAQVTAQRDELLAALKLVQMISRGYGSANLGWTKGENGKPDYYETETVKLAPKTIEQIDAAISKAKQH